MTRRFVAIALPLYLVTVAATVVGMSYARQQAIAIYGTNEARDDWRKWVDEAKRQEREGPVRRKAPDSARPPAAVLMEDHFATCLIGALVMGSALYWSFALLTRGALSPTVAPRQDSTDPPSSHLDSRLDS